MNPAAFLFTVVAVVCGQMLYDIIVGLANKDDE